MNEGAYDHLERRCPRLGGPVSFGYCRHCGQEGACCPKALNCWWEYFDVAAHLKAHLAEAAFEELVSTKPEHKVTSLLELIARAKARHREE